jgi:dynein heavy chain 1
VFNYFFRLSSAEDIAQKIVLLFQLCKDQLSNQSHYDFGLRALKSVLRSAGNIKRQAQNEVKFPPSSKCI